MPINNTIQVIHREPERVRGVVIYGTPYFAGQGCLYDGTNTKPKLLCNFLPWLTQEITLDNGQETAKRIRLAGIAEEGEMLPEVEITAKDFLKCNWIFEKWGMDCILSVGGTTYQHIRNAIQTTAWNAEEKTVYTSTGWRKIDGSWRYLLPGNAFFDVELPGGKDGCFRGYGLPQENTPADLTVLSDLLRSELMPRDVLWSLLAFTFLTPFTEFLIRAGCSPRYPIFLVGKTGSCKSSVAAVFLSFFGKFDCSCLPSSFADTANYVSEQLFPAKDVLTCVDDFHPTDRNEAQRMTGAAQRVMRAVGERTGKGRLNEKADAKAVHWPRGNVILTGEFFPKIGQSGAARYFPLRLEQEDVDRSVLTVYQDKARSGDLVRTMIDFTDWITDTWLRTEEMEKEFLRRLSDTFYRNRSELQTVGIQAHGRLIEAMAHQLMGFEILLRFLVDKEQLTEEESTAMLKEYRTLLLQNAAEQAIQIRQSDPCQVFLEKLSILMDTGQATIIPTGSKEEPQERLLIFEDEQYYYLNIDTAQREVRRFCAEQGEYFSISARDLREALAKDGCIVRWGDKTTRNTRVGCKPRHVSWLVKDRLTLVEGEEASEPP